MAELLATITAIVKHLPNKHNQKDHGRVKGNVEEFDLKTAQPVNTKLIHSGYNKPSVITFAGETKAIQKTVRIALEADNEIIAYNVGTIMEVDVPLTVRMSKDTIRQLFAKGKIMSEDNLISYAQGLDEETKTRSAAFEYLISSSDRKGSNVLIGRDGQPVFIDNGNTNFPGLTKLIDNKVRSSSWRETTGTPFIGVENIPLTSTVRNNLARVSTTKMLPRAVRARAAFMLKLGYVPRSVTTFNQKQVSALYDVWLSVLDEIK